MDKCNKKNKFHLEIIFISVAFTALLVWFFRDALFSGKIFVERDLSRYYYPLRLFAADCIKSGIFPFWNPYIFCGNPLFASLQSAVLYPLSIIYYIGDFTKMFDVFIVAHFILAGMFTYLFLRQIRCSVLASFLSGIAFALSGYMTSVVNLLTTLSVVTWFPLAMLFYYRMTRCVIASERSERSNLLAPRRLLRRPATFGGGTPRKDGSSSQLYAILLGIVLTVMFLGGEPSVLYAVIGLFFCGSVYFTIEEYIEGRRRDRTVFCPYDGYIANMALAIIVFLGLAAFQILPFVEFVKLSSREMTNTNVAGIWNLPIKDTPGMILPFFHDIYKIFTNYWQRQSWLDNYYIGILVFILFIIGVLFDRSKRARAIFILGLVGFALSLGKDTVLFELLFKLVPGFKFMRYSIRFFFIPTFAICALAGIGLDYYAKYIKKDKRLKIAAFVILTAAFFSSVGFLALDLNFQGCLDFIRKEATRLAWHLNNMPRAFVEDAVKEPVFLKFLSMDLLNFRRMLLLLAFFGTLFFLGAKKQARVNIFILPALVFLATIDVFQVNGGYSPLFSIKDFKAPTSNVEFLIKEKNKSKQLFRICCSPQATKEQSYVPEADFYKGIQASKDRLIEDRMIEFGIYDVSMYGSIYMYRNSRFLNIVMEKRHDSLERLLELLNVRYIASPKPPKVNGVTLVNKADAASLYETKRYLPRAFLAERAVVIKDEDKILDELKSGGFDPAHRVILEEDSLLGTPLKEVSPQKKAVFTDTVTIASYTPNKIVIDATVTEKPKFLVLSDTYYPGWKVFVDGRQEKILRADYIFRAVYLEPGRHTVVFVYSPASFKIGVFISLISLIILTLIYRSNIIKSLRHSNPRG